ncbi:MAG: di-heme-cytochrome C peroxidase [Acidobacteriota bacterium]
MKRAAHFLELHGSYSFYRAVAVVLVLLPFLGCRPYDPEPTPPPAGLIELDVGLTEAERAAWRWTSEGSDLFPVAILRALNDVHTGKPFIEGMDRYGFLPSAVSAENPYGLPVGWAINVPEFDLLDLDYVGVNCSGCHTGQIDYQGASMRIDGAPNMANIEAFGVAVKDSVIATLADPVQALLFVSRLVRLEPPEADGTQTFNGALDDDTRAFLEQKAERMSDPTMESADPIAFEMGESFGAILRGESEPEQEAAELTAQEAFGATEAFGHIRDLYDFVAKYRALLENRLQLAIRAIYAIETSPKPGPGRDDPWGIIRNLLFRTPTELTAPTSIPHLYYAREYGWYHADGNTNSVMERDIAQAVALGAFVDADTHQSTLLPRRIWVLEDMLAKLTSPAWPEDILGTIDQDLAARGDELFHRKMTVPSGSAMGGSAMAGATVSCADCHAAWQGQLFTLDAIGTDPNRAENFLRPQGDEDFWVAIPRAVKKIEAVAFEISDISPEEAREHEYNYPPEWRGTGKYIARRLDGVWSTAPYLHNGSVPNLHDLLLPPDQRPTTFALGDRNYDPKKVGYVTETDDPIFVFDTTANGSANSGHVFGTDLSEEDRWALVEYLKTL